MATRVKKIEWSEVDEFSCVAIELATGVCINRKRAVPAGLYTKAAELRKECNKRFPRGEYTVGQAARVFLEMRVAEFDARDFGLEKSAA